ncbi:MAG: hypoxanthine phosphoribosyltransferase, partial [Thermomicrobiales bacterium]|nr:hypoxanthine phosphoribosyltransferase [Thermomicrobiales bacterium]
PPRTLVAGRRILVVTDVVSTGLSLAYLTWWLQRRGARQVEICTLLDRQAARLIEVPVRYVGFEAPNELLVGFGLHLRRQFRNLPYIASLVSAPQPETAG